jgi:large subunit ribosomal protein L4
MDNYFQKIIMKAPIYNLKLEQIGDINLPKIFTTTAKAEDKIIAQTLRIYLSNLRKAHAKSKTRAEIAGTTKKMWKQKGTGRARHSTAKAPIFVGGGRAHGPNGEQNFKLKLSKKARKTALGLLLNKFAKAKKIVVVEKFGQLEPKTKIGMKFITGLMDKNKVLSESRRVGVITSQTNTNIRRALKNIKNINLISLKSLNSLDLSKQHYLIFSKKAINELNKF